MGRNLLKVVTSFQQQGTGKTDGNKERWLINYFDFWSELNHCRRAHHRNDLALTHVVLMVRRVIILGKINAWKLINLITLKVSSGT